MWYFLIKTVPLEDDAKEIGGAYVNCWINFQLEDGAQQLARFYLEKDGWRIEAVEKTEWVGRETYEDNPDGLNSLPKQNRTVLHFSLTHGPRMAKTKKLIDEPKTQGQKPKT